MCGANSYGQLGMGITSSRELEPILLNYPNGKLFLGGNTTFVSHNDKTYGTGRVENGQLYPNLSADVLTPIELIFEYPS